MRGVGYPSCVLCPSPTPYYGGVWKQMLPGLLGPALLALAFSIRTHGMFRSNILVLFLGESQV